MRHRLPVLLAAAALLLAGCGGSSGSSEPTVSGALGSKPTVTAPDGDPSGRFDVNVLEKGDGDTVAEGDLLVANYLGQIWRNDKVFDNSYDSKQARAFGIGVGQVVPGWDEGLVGKTVGSRVLLVLPPDKGYGEAGNKEAGITGTDTLIFVVDILGRFPRTLGASGTPVTGLPDTLPAVSGGDAGAAPTLSFPPTAAAPTTSAATLILSGNGEPLDLTKQLATQVVQQPWGAAAATFDSRTTAPVALRTASQLPGLEAALQGQKAGSRVLLSVSGADTGKDPVALVVDVIGTF